MKTIDCSRCGAYLATVEDDDTSSSPSCSNCLTNEAWERAAAASIPQPPQHDHVIAGTRFTIGIGNGPAFVELDRNAMTSFPLRENDASSPAASRLQIFRPPGDVIPFEERLREAERLLGIEHVAELRSRLAFLGANLYAAGVEEARYQAYSIRIYGRVLNPNPPLVACRCDDVDDTADPPSAVRCPIHDRPIP